MSRRVGGAVRRNRIKRRVREAFRLTKQCIPGSLDIVVTGQREMADMKFEQLTEGLVEAIRQATRSTRRPRAGTRIGKKAGR